MPEEPPGTEIVAIGQPYASMPSLPRDGGRITLRPGRTELTMFMAGPSPAEIEEVRTGRAEFGWITRPHSGMLCFRLGHLPWWDAPCEPYQASVPEWPQGVTPGMHQLLAIVLVDTRTAITSAVRLLTWPPHFAGAVRDAVAGHLARPRDDMATLSEISDLWAAGDPEHLMRAYAEVTCTGGQQAPARKSGRSPGRTPGRKSPGQGEQRKGRRPT